MYMKRTLCLHRLLQTQLFGSDSYQFLVEARRSSLQLECVIQYLGSFSLLATVYSSVSKSLLKVKIRVVVSSWSQDSDCGLSNKGLGEFLTSHTAGGLFGEC